VRKAQKKSSAIDHRLVAFAALALSLAGSAAAQTFRGSEIVATTSSELAATIEARRAELESDHQKLYALVDTLLLPRFDMQRGCRAILAEHWQTSSPAERERFVSAFYDYLVASYGDLLLFFKPDTLRVLPFEGDPSANPTHVRTILTMNDGTEVDVDFVMLERDGDWRVVDIVAEGVSYVKSYRSQFRVDIAADGIESVLEWLEQKAAPRNAPPP
jgi:phospholipid transport system substrate-binding protein